MTQSKLVRAQEGICRVVGGCFPLAAWLSAFGCWLLDGMAWLLAVVESAVCVSIVCCLLPASCWLLAAWCLVLVVKACCLIDLFSLDEPK